MTKLATIFAASTLLAFTGAPALATGSVTKTWVSSTTGNDTGTCQFISPCKTFAYAVTQTLPGGAINVKDSGSYGPLTITQAISVVSQGALAEISVPSGTTGITVNAGATDEVILQGLIIDGHNVGKDGIDFKAGMSLTIENCHLRNVATYGISIQPTGAKFYHVSNTEIANAGSIGVYISPFNSIPYGSFANISMYGNAVAIVIQFSNMTLKNSTISGNGIGIQAFDQGSVFIRETTVSENTNIGIQLSSGTVVSYGDNDINSNGTDVSGTLTSMAKR